MAWIIGDSFDFYAATADATTHWGSNADSSWAVSSTTRFSAGRSLKSAGNSAYLTKAFGSNETTVFITAAFYYGTTLGAATGSILFELRDGATVQCTVEFNGNGDIILHSGGVGGSALATYSSAFAGQTWAHFQIKAVINNTTGSITIRKDGASSDSFSATGLNTRGGTANNYANVVAVGAAAGAGNGYIDDLLIYSGAGNAPNTWIGDVRAVQLMPTADTAQKDFYRSTGTTNYSLVDEGQQNGDTDYVLSSVVGQRDLYDLADLTTTPTSIIGVQSRVFARKSDVGARSGQVTVKSGATEVTGTSTLLASSYGWLGRVDTVDPNTSSAWAAAAVNALQIGPKVAA